MHDPVRFRELLDAFRDSHGEFDVPFSLHICRLRPTPQPLKGTAVSWDDMLYDWVKALDQPRGDVHLIGEIRFPVVDPTLPPWARLTAPSSDELMRRQCGDELMGRGWRSAVVYSKGSSPLQKQAVERFTNLAKAAGKVLPLSLRDALPREPSFTQPKKAVDRWLRLMFWTNPPEQQELLKLNQKGSGWAWFGQPFSDAADVIERCRLASSKPMFATEGNRWPCWAGQIPKSVLRVHPNQSVGKKDNSRYSSLAPTPEAEGEIKDAKSAELEQLIGHLGSVAQAVLLAMWRNRINTVLEKKTGQAIAKLPSAGLQYNTPMKEALVMLQRVPYQFVECPGRGYFLTQRGCEAAEQLNPKTKSNKKRGQSRR